MSSPQQGRPGPAYATKAPEPSIAGGRCSRLGLWRKERMAIRGTICSWRFLAIARPAAREYTRGRK